MEFIAPSGEPVKINVAAWKDAKALKAALELEIAAHGITDINSILDDGLISLIMKVDSSPAFDAALWPCLVRCLRGNNKIIESTFDDAKAREDYYQIVVACVQVNLRPLVLSLVSQLAVLGLLKNIIGKSQESASTTSAPSSPAA